MPSIEDKTKIELRVDCIFIIRAVGSICVEHFLNNLHQEASSKHSLRLENSDK